MIPLFTKLYKSYKISCQILNMSISYLQGFICTVNVVGKSQLFNGLSTSARLINIDQD